MEVKPLFSVEILVEVTGLEPAASCSQSKRATNCATPRFIQFLLGFLQKIRNCGTTCGRSLIIAHFKRKGKRKNRSIKGFFEVSGILLELPISQSQN